MGDAGTGHGWRSESNTKDIVLVLSCDVEMFSPGFIMAQLSSH